MPETLAMLTIDAAAAALHMRMGGLRQVQRRGQVELQDRLDKARTGALRGHGGRSACVVDQDVDPAVIGRRPDRPAPWPSGSRMSPAGILTPRAGFRARAAQRHHPASGCAKATAIPPRPRVPPVTMATCPLRSMAVAAPSRRLSPCMPSLMESRFQFRSKSALSEAKGLFN
jgi:hypothetical protein